MCVHTIGSSTCVHNPLYDSIVYACTGSNTTLTTSYTSNYVLLLMATEHSPHSVAIVQCLYLVAVVIVLHIAGVPILLHYYCIWSKIGTAAYCRYLPYMSVTLTLTLPWPCWWPLANGTQTSMCKAVACDERYEWRSLVVRVRSCGACEVLGLWCAGWTETQYAYVKHTSWLMVDWPDQVATCYVAVS